MGLGAGAGGAKGEELRLTRSWENKKEAQGPKHGKAPDGWRATPAAARDVVPRRARLPPAPGRGLSMARGARRVQEAACGR